MRRVEPRVVVGIVAADIPTGAPLNRRATFTNAAVNGQMPLDVIQLLSISAVLNYVCLRPFREVRVCRHGFSHVALENGFSHVG